MVCLRYCMVVMRGGVMGRFMGLLDGLVLDVRFDAGRDVCSICVPSIRLGHRVQLLLQGVPSNCRTLNWPTVLGLANELGLLGMRVNSLH